MCSQNMLSVSFIAITALEKLFDWGQRATRGVLRTRSWGLIVEQVCPTYQRIT